MHFIALFRTISEHLPRWRSAVLSTSTLQESVVVLVHNKQQIGHVSRLQKQSGRAIPQGQGILRARQSRDTPACAASRHFPVTLLHRNRYRDSDARIVRVIQIVTIICVVQIDVIGLVPVRRPIVRPRIDERNPIAVVLESRKPADKQYRKTAYPEMVVTSEIETETGIGNAIAIVSATLLPRFVIAAPVTGFRLREPAAHLP
jgi:hypothetical protein